MKKIIVKYIGVKNYTVNDDVTKEEIHDVFQTDLANVPLCNFSISSFVYSIHK